MPKVTIYRPNRTKKQYFTACAVARIAWNCVNDTEATAKDVVSCASKRLGYTVIALPTKDRQLPAGVQGKLDKIKSLIEKLNAILFTVNEYVTNLWATFDVLMKLLPTWLTDNEKTIEDKVTAATLGKVAARRLTWWAQIGEKVRTSALDLKDGLVELQLDLEQVLGYLDQAEQLADMEIINLNKPIPNCQCKKSQVAQYLEWFPVTILEYNESTGEVRGTGEVGDSYQTIEQMSEYLAKMEGFVKDETMEWGRVVTYRFYFDYENTPERYWKLFKHFGGIVKQYSKPEKLFELLRTTTKRV